MAFHQYLTHEPSPKNQDATAIGREGKTVESTIDQKKLGDPTAQDTKGSTSVTPPKIHEKGMPDT